jgi:ketosteroid isomerase-like protein
MRRAWIVLSSLLALGCYASDRSASVAQAGAPADPATVQAAIDAQLATFRDAMIKGDTAGMASIYTEDAIVLPANLPIARGRAAMNAMNAGMFASISVTDMQFATTDLIVTGD